MPQGRAEGCEERLNRREGLSEKVVPGLRLAGNDVGWVGSLGEGRRWGGQDTVQVIGGCSRTTASWGHSIVLVS